MDIVYSDQDVVVINKPRGMPSHGFREKGTQETALHWVCAQYPEIASAGPNPLEGGLCHRLDNETSGLLLFARCPEAYARYRHAFAHQQISKTYHALVHGLLDFPTTIAIPIAHHSKNKKKMVVVWNKHIRHRGHPKSATTQITTVQWGSGWSLVQIHIQGGRRHQIRVHLAHAGFPLVGDTLYGGKPILGFTSQALVATQMTLLDGTNIEIPHGLVKNETT